MNEKNRSKAITALVAFFLAIDIFIGVISAVCSVVASSKTYSTQVCLETIDTAEHLQTNETFDAPETKEEPATQEEPETKEEPTSELLPPPPKKHIVDFPHITQRDKLMTGCEIVSSSMVLSYYGKKNITLDQIIKNMGRGDVHVDKNGRWYGLSPNDAFIGDPHEITGIGCFPPVVKNMIDNFRFEDIDAEITTGQSLEQLSNNYIANDIPVMIWVTIGMSDTFDGDKWYLMDKNGHITDEEFIWPVNEHCVVLVGYDKQSYYISDPLDSRQTVKYDKKTVEKCFNELGNMSVVVYKK